MFGLYVIVFFPFIKMNVFSDGSLYDKQVTITVHLHIPLKIKSPKIK